jgi:hypothetical protein
MTSIAWFLKSVIEHYRGRPPHLSTDPRALMERYIKLKSALRGAEPPRGTAVQGGWDSLDETVEGLTTARLPYREMERLLERLPVWKGKGVAAAMTLELLLGLHDLYVSSKNKVSSPPVSPSGPAPDQRCRRCGACCSGEGTGPISSSPVDLIRWVVLGRDDVLYYTELGWPGDVDDLRGLLYNVCPFLRFDGEAIGLCLIHPVKPIQCREFLCGDTLGRFSA